MAVPSRDGHSQQSTVRPAAIPSAGASRVDLGMPPNLTMAGVSP